MKRREAVIARQQDRKPNTLFEIDYLLGVHDMYRMGALRFKLDLDGAFLDNNKQLSAPPITSLPELENATQQIEDTKEDTKDLDNPDYLKSLNMLISPGSSLGGARPKSCVIDNNKSLWIAKFPSRYDDYDIAAWEYVIYQLAIDAGINMSECRLEKFNNQYHTFLHRSLCLIPHSTAIAKMCLA
jgi:serine/threonine-protein kinase HipA